MRLLSDEEMDAIFGGGEDYMQTMETVTVTGQQLRQSGGVYMSGYDAFVREEAWGGCTTCSQYYASLYRVVPQNQVPSKERVKCIANATQPTTPYKPGYQLNIVNSRVYRNPQLSGTETAWVHRRGDTSGSSAPGYTQEVNGVTVSSTDRSSGGTVIYGPAMKSGVIPNYIRPDTGQPGDMAGHALSAQENIALTIGHELWHQYNGPATNANDELLANGWGVKSVVRMRNGATAHCPD